MAYHKWSNLKLTINDYREIFNCHMAQSSCFNRMVEIYIWQNILKNSNDATCQFFMLPHVNILVCTIVANVVSVVARTHPWIHIKSPHSYSMKKYFIRHLRLVVVCNLLFSTTLIFNHCVACN
jgi:hypothetical protein